jgi:hypothetical protein
MLSVSGQTLASEVDNGPYKSVSEFEKDRAIRKAAIQAAKETAIQAVRDLEELCAKQEFMDNSPHEYFGSQMAKVNRIYKYIDEAGYFLNEEIVKITNALAKSTEAVYNAGLLQDDRLESNTDNKWTDEKRTGIEESLREANESVMSAISPAKKLLGMEKSEIDEG